MVPRKSNAGAVANDFGPRAKRPERRFYSLAASVLSHGGPGYLQFAITNISNAKCDFCGFAAGKMDPKQRRSVSLKEAKDAIDIAVKNHIGYILFVGGEPLLHKELGAMVRHAAESGIHPMICTNGSLWTDDSMRALANHGLSSVIMSIDSHDVLRHERNRGLPDLCARIKELKRRGGFTVVNPAESLNEMQRHLKGESERFGCLGGHKYFYLDWNLNLYRCHYWETPMCSVYDFDESKLIRDGCTRCMIDCYRDPSILQHVAISVSDACRSLKKGRLFQAFRHLCDSRNWISAKAVWEDRQWIQRV